MLLIDRAPDVPLPDVEQFHTLVSLDLSDSKSERLFGYPSWLYKAVSGNDGNYYCLRRLQGEMEYANSMSCC